MIEITKIGERVGRSLRLLYHTRGSPFRMRDLKPPYPIRVGNTVAYLNAEDSDESRGIYAEVVLYDGYGVRAVPRQEAIKRVVDIGANVGAFSLLTSMLYPEAEIHAYDPHPVAFSWLSKNVTGRKISAFNLAVADRSGELKFDVKAHATLSALSESGTHTVLAIAPTEIFSGQEIDFLKLDCEGAEFLILKDPALLRRTKRLAMEYHLDSEHSFQRLLDLLSAGGHKVTKVKESALAPQFGILWSMRAGL